VPSKKTQWVKGFGLKGCIAKKKGLVASFVALLRSKTRSLHLKCAQHKPRFQGVNDVQMKSVDPLWKGREV